jgi:hypothetical protein
MKYSIKIKSLINNKHKYLLKLNFKFSLLPVRCLFTMMGVAYYTYNQSVLNNSNFYQNFIYTPNNLIIWFSKKRLRKISI